MAGFDFGDAFVSGAKASSDYGQRQFNQQMQMNEQVQGQIDKTMQVAAQIIKASEGRDPLSVAKAVNPLFESAASLALRVGGPENAARVQNMGRAMLASFTPQPQTAPAPAPVTSAPLTAPVQPQLPQSDVITPTQVAAANPPTPNERVAQGFQDAEDGGLPAGAKPVQSTAKLKTSAIPIGSAKTRTMIENGITTQDSLDYRAELWLLDPNSVKGVARGKEGAAITNAVIERGTEIAKARGIAPGETLAQGALTGSSKKALDQIVKVSNAIETFENTALKNGDVLLQLAQKVDATGVPVFEKWIRAGRQATGDPDVAAFNAQMILFKAEAAKILTNPNLTGVLTDSARHELDAALSPGASAKQISRTLQILRRDFENRSNANKEQITKLMNSFSDRSGAFSTNQSSEIPPPPTGFIRTK